MSTYLYNYYYSSHLYEALFLKKTLLLSLNFLQYKALDFKGHPTTFWIHLDKITFSWLLDFQCVHPHISLRLTNFFSHVDDLTTECRRALGPVTTISSPSWVAPELPPNATTA